LGTSLQETLPPAAVSAVTVPPERPRTRTHDASTRSPNQPGRTSGTRLMSLTRSLMLNGTLDLEHGGGRWSLHANWVPACWLMKSIRAPSWVLFTW